MSTPEQNLTEREMSPDELIDFVGREYRVPKGLRQSLFKRESGGQQYNADGSVKVAKYAPYQKAGRGMGQLIPGTAKSLGVNPDDPVENVVGSMHYLKSLYDQAKPNSADDAEAWAKATAGYFSGPGNMGKAPGQVFQADRSDGRVRVSEYVEGVLSGWAEYDGPDNDWDEHEPTFPKGATRGEVLAPPTFPKGTISQAPPAPAEASPIEPLDTPGRRALPEIEAYQRELERPPQPLNASEERIEEFGEPETVNASATTSVIVPPPPQRQTFDPATEAGRRGRDARAQLERTPGAFLEVAVPLPSEDRLSEVAAGAEMVRGAYVRALVARGLNERAAERVVGRDYSLKDATGKAVAPADAFSEDNIDYKARTMRVKLDAAHISKLVDDYNANAPLPVRAYRWATDETRSPGEKALDVAVPLVEKGARGLDLATRPLQAGSAAFWAKVKGADNVQAVKTAWEEFRGENPELAKNVIAEALRHSETLKGINPRLPGLAGFLAEMVADPANVIPGGLIAKGATRLGRVAKAGSKLEKAANVLRDIGIFEPDIPREAFKATGAPEVLGDLTRRMPETRIEDLPDIPATMPEGVRIRKAMTPAEIDALRVGVERQAPLDADLVDRSRLPLPKGYRREGDIYRFRTESPSVETPTPEAVPVPERAAGGQQASASPAPEAIPKRAVWQHRDFGRVVEHANQAGVPEGKVRVVDGDARTHIIQKSNMRGAGNQIAVPVREAADAGTSARGEQQFTDVQGAQAGRLPDTQSTAQMETPPAPVGGRTEALPVGADVVQAADVPPPPRVSAAPDSLSATPPRVATPDRLSAPVPGPRAFRAQMKKAFNLKDDAQADTVLDLTEARAKAWATEAPGRDPADYYVERFGGIEKDGEIGAGARQGDKAAVTFMADNRAVLRAFQKADVSSAVHELAHVFRRDLHPTLLKDAESALGVKGEWTKPHEEQFARGFERYLKTGEAPNVKLRRVYESFKTWLTEIYGAVRGKNHPLNFKPNEKLVSVFDRMLGGEPKGEYGQLIYQLHKPPDAGTPAFFENAQVKRALGLKADASTADVRAALTEAAGKPRSSHLSPEDVRTWADVKGLQGAAREALDFATAQYKTKTGKVDADTTSEPLAPAEHFADNESQFIEDFYAGRIGRAEFARRAGEAGLHDAEIRAAVADAGEARAVGGGQKVPAGVRGGKVEGGGGGRPDGRDDVDILYQSAESEVLKRFRAATAKARTGEAKRLEESIADLERRIDEKDFTPAGKPQPRAVTAEVSQLRARRDALRQEYNALRSSMPVQGPKLSESTTPKAGPRLSEAPKLGPKLSESTGPKEGPRLAEAPVHGPKVSEMGPKLGPKQEELKRTPLPEVITSLRRAGLLTGVRTQLRNFVSNAGFQGAEELSRPFQVLADLIVKPASEPRVVGGIDVAAIARSAKGATVEGIPQAWDILLGREPRAGRTGDMLKSQAEQMHAAQTDKVRSGLPILDAYVNTVFGAMSAGDRPFKIYAAGRSLDETATLNARAAKRANPSVNVKERASYYRQNPTAAMQAQAVAYAEYATFQNDNAFSEVVSKIKDIHPVAKFGVEQIAPFDKTPTNIIARIIEYSPAGLAQGGYKIVKGRANADALRTAGKVVDGMMTPADRRAFAQTMGRATFGTAVFTLGMTLAAKGYLSGMSDYKDDKEDYFAKRQMFGGPGMLHVPGTNKRISILGSPAGNVLALGATTYEQMSKAKDVDKGIVGTGKALARVGLDQPLVRAIRESTDTQSVGKTAGSYLGGFVPTLVKDAGEVIDPEPRQAYGKEQGFKEQLQIRIPPPLPFGRQNLPVSPSANKEERGTYARRLLRALDPLNVTTEGKSKGGGRTSSPRSSGGRQSTARPATARPTR